MTQEQIDVRSERAEKDLFVISPTDDGWRVRSAHNPSQYHLVSGDCLRCSCPDFEKHVAEDPNWTCKHILAVQDYQAKTSGQQNPETYEEAERAAMQSETAPPQPENGNASPQAQMLVKRSLSPDGRIDSISIEFSSQITEATPTQIKNRAFKTLKLQTEIVRNFLASQSNKADGNKAPSEPKKANGAVSAKLLDVGSTNGQYGERFYLNVDVNGRRARFFGTLGQIVRAIAAASEKLSTQELEPGLRVDLPCRVIAQESSDGRYLNVTHVLPADYRRKGNGAA